MSLKAVELQVALPRTQEISRIQEQQQQRSMHEQQVLIEDRKQLDEIARKRPESMSEPAKGQIREKQQRERKRHAQSPAQTEGATEPHEKGNSAKGHVPMTDPLRGRHIDISL